MLARPTAPLAPIIGAWPRAGKAKAVTATARKLAVLFYNTLRYGVDYSDYRARYYEERHRERVIQNLARLARQLGYNLELASVEGVY